jgi:hypothetical protein
MSEGTENIVIKILQKIQEDLAEVRTDVRDLKIRLTSVETTLLVMGRLSSMEQQVAGLRVDFAHHQIAVDRQYERILRIERRLELADPEAP